MDAALVDAAREAIEVLLDLSGQSISLSIGKSVRTEMPGGGYTYAPAGLRPPQTFFLKDTSGSSSSKTQGDSGMTSLSRQLLMIGRHNAVANIGDYWINENTRYRIDECVSAKPYKKEWIVTAVGPESPDG